MRLRIVGAVAAALLATTTLTACRTNVGYAATIDGTRISESQVAGYLTPQAQPLSNQSGPSTPPRSFVLQTMIFTRLLPKLIASLPGREPTQAEIGELQRRLLNGVTAQKYVSSRGAKGYTDDFARLLVRSSVYGQVLTTLNQQGVNINQALSKLSFPVSVNPRYGSWNSKTYSLNSTGSAGEPTFLRLQGSS